MAMAFTYRVLENNARNYILQINGVDAASTTAATRDGSDTGIIAANGYTPTVHLKIRKINYNTNNCVARLQWHATTNVDLAIINGFGVHDLKDTQGIWNDGGTGVTGDIDIQTVASATVTAGTNPITASLFLVLYAIKGV